MSIFPSLMIDASSLIKNASLNRWIGASFEQLHAALSWMADNFFSQTFAVSLERAPVDKTFWLSCYQQELDSLLQQPFSAKVLGARLSEYCDLVGKNTLSPYEYYLGLKEAAASLRRQSEIKKVERLMELERDFQDELQRAPAFVMENFTADIQFTLTLWLRKKITVEAFIDTVVFYQPLVDARIFKNVLLNLHTHLQSEKFHEELLINVEIILDELEVSDNTGNKAPIARMSVGLKTPTVAAGNGILWSLCLVPYAILKYILTHPIQSVIIMLALQSRGIFAVEPSRSISISLVDDDKQSSRDDIQDRSLSDGFTPKLLGRYSHNFQALNVVVSGSTAYVAAAMAGLEIIDVSNPADPRLLSTYSTGDDYVKSVAIANHTAYLAYNGNGLQILDVSNSSQPRLLGSYLQRPGQVVDVAVSGNTAYVLWETAGLTIVNVTDPSDLSVLGRYATGSSHDAHSVAIVDNLVYLASGLEGLKIVNVTVPANPTLVGNYSASANSALYGIAVSGKLAYLAYTNAGLKILDLENPADLHVVGSYPATRSDTPYRVAVSKNTAYLASHEAGLQILDISNATEPEWIGAYAEGVGNFTSALGVVVLGELAYLAYDYEGLYLLDVTRTPLPTPTWIPTPTSYPTPTWIPTTPTLYPTPQAGPGQVRKPNLVPLSLGLIGVIMGGGGLAYCLYQRKKLRAQQQLLLAARVGRPRSLSSITREQLGRRRCSPLTPLNVISSSELSLGRVLGQSGLGIVRAGIYKGERVAVKTLHIAHLSMRQLTDFSAAAKFMMHWAHPNLVRMYAVCLEAKCYSLVMELLPRGSLYDVLRLPQYLGPRARLQISLGICAGLLFLHEHNKIHGNIKSQNILLDDGLHPKLTDVGLANVKPAASLIAISQADIDNLPWRAPEIGEGSEPTSMSDIYSYGVVLWELWSGRPAYPNHPNDPEVIGVIEDPSSQEIPDEIKGMMIDCWKAPAQRPSAARLYSYLQSQRHTLWHHTPAPRSAAAGSSPSLRERQPSPSSLGY